MTDLIVCSNALLQWGILPDLMRQPPGEGSATPLLLGSSASCLFLMFTLFTSLKKTISSFPIVVPSIH